MRHFAAVGIVLLLGLPVQGVAAPGGRAWSPIDTLGLSGHTVVAPHFMHVATTGDIFLLCEAAGGIGQDVVAFVWNGVDWEDTWRLGAGSSYVRRFVSANERHDFVWHDITPLGPSGTDVYLVVASASATAVDPPETLAVVRGGQTAYAGASSSTRRWVAVDDAGDLRVLYSDAFDQWQEAEVPGVGSQGVAIAALDDTTALLVHMWAFDGMRWGILSGNTWMAGGYVTMDPTAGGPVLRIRPSGGFWLGWADKSDQYQMASFRNGIWTDFVSIDCAYQIPSQYFSSSSELSDDLGEYPAAGWVANSTAGIDKICISVPTSLGFTTADDLVGSEAGLLDAIAVDQNGDVWVAWWKYFSGMYWTHTYTTAVAQHAAISGTTERRVLSWRLSHVAPESWWSVLRRSDSGAFEALARVQAGSGLDMQWVDDEPLASRLTYAIRRDHVDRRYEWVSNEIVWDFPTPTQLALATVSALPEMVKLTWSGPGAGSLAADVQRRTDSIDWQRLGRASSDGPDRVIYDDYAVSAGARYAYRLAHTEYGVERFTQETWVDVPHAAFSLGGFSPNPSAGAAVISFSLPASGDTQLEVLDISGRRVARQRLKGLPAGDHVVDLRKSLPPGLYIIRLEFGSEELVTRGVVVR